MSAALSYTQKKFKKSLNQSRNKQMIFDAFEKLETEIKKLDPLIQINLYSVTTQFLDSLVQEPEDAINPLEVFALRCQSILGHDTESLKKLGLALGVIAISLATVMTAGAFGVGIGVLIGLWQTPMLFMTALLASETAAVATVAATAATGVIAGIVSGFTFFKEPAIKSALNHCVETVKESYLSNPSDPHIEERNELQMAVQ